MIRAMDYEEVSGVSERVGGEILRYCCRFPTNVTNQSNINVKSGIVIAPM